MKLIFCEECWDVFKLDREVRKCKCGKCAGKYNEDGHTAVTNGEGYCLAIDNRSLSQRLNQLYVNDDLFPDGDYENLYETMRVVMWIRPHQGVGNPRSIVDTNLLQKPNEKQE